MTEPTPLYQSHGAGKTPRTCRGCRYCEPSARLGHLCAWASAHMPSAFPEWMDDDIRVVDPDAPTDCHAWEPPLLIVEP